MLRRVALCWLVVVGAQGCAVDAHEPGDVHVVGHSITDGTLHFGHPSVGELRVGNASCTCTLVGRRTVLTAAHCVQEGRTHIVTLAGQQYTAVSATRHPQYQGSNFSYDIGVIILGSAPPVAPSAVNVTAPTAGQKLTLVGFGVTATNKNDSGTKRIATNYIDKVYPNQLRFLGSGNGIGNTCSGDSGGPAFSVVGGEEVVVGVTSNGMVPCGSDGYDTRVDVFVSWLDKEASGDLVKARGVVGRQPQSDDKVPPTVSFTSHHDGQHLQPGPVTITADASDNVALATVSLVINGRVFGTRAGRPFSWSLQFVPGQKDLELVAADTAGNMTKTTIVVTVEGQLSKFGDACTSSVQCESRLCVYSRTLGQRYCSEVCSPSSNTCPTNGTCVQTTQQGFYVCALNEGGEPAQGGGAVRGPGIAPVTPKQPAQPTEPSPDAQVQPRGGCAVGGAADPSSALALCLALLAFALARRGRGRDRRRRRQR